jgi:hypothetical protein
MMLCGILEKGGILGKVEDGKGGGLEMGKVEDRRDGRWERWREKWRMGEMEDGRDGRWERRCFANGIHAIRRRARLVLIGL